MKQQVPVSTWAAIVIALCSLILSIYAGYEDRRYKRLSVKPEMQASFFYTIEGTGWILGNHGLGPARIKWAEVMVDGKPKKNWKEMVLDFKFAQPIKKINYFHFYPAPNVLVKSGIENRIFWVKDKPLAETVKQNSGRVTIRICYCSLYDECWRTNDDGAGSIEASCKELPPVPFGPEPISALTTEKRDSWQGTR